MDGTTLLIIIGVIAGGAYFWYASIISKRNKALETLSGIDVQLKKRHDLIPNVVKLAKKFMEHEKGLLEEITELRSQAVKGYTPEDSDSLSKHLSVEQLLSGKMGQLMVAVEDYPDLKSDETMLQAQRTYNEVEEQISAARRFYNASVTSLNNSVQIFPGNIIARKVKISAMPFFETDEASKAPVNADDILN